MKELKRELIDNLIARAKNASKNAYSPYSNYNVGAAVIVEDGKIFTGCNVENASYGLTVCAERVAIFKAVSDGYRQIKAIAIYAEGAMPYPCGACRQVISEFGDENSIIVVSNGNKIEVFKLEELLPKSFKFEK